VKLLAPGVIIVALVAVAAWAGTRSGPPIIAWSRVQAESISLVRGMPVHVLRCDGVGPAVGVNQAARYRHFACTAGARASFDTYDTVGITYVLEPLGPFSGASSRYVLTDVYFSALSVP
jgi:hypothetical protein